MAQPAFRTQPARGVVLAVLNCSVGSADLWQEGFALGGDLQTFGQQHFVMCSGQLLPSAGFELALNSRPKSVAPKLKANNTTVATAILNIRCITDMLRLEAQRSKAILAPHGWVRGDSRESGNPGLVVTDSSFCRNNAQV